MKSLIQKLFPTTKHSHELAILLEAGQEAAQVCVKVSETDMGTVTKSDATPVTIADYTAQAIIIHHLRRAFPTDRVVAEESFERLDDDQRKIIAQLVTGFDVDEIIDHVDVEDCGQDCRRFWTIDPIDGTKGFIRGDQYAVCIALIENEQVVCSFMGCPRLENSLGGVGSMFIACRKNGAYELPFPISFTNDIENLAKRLPIKVSPNKHTCKDAIWSESFEASHTDRAFSTKFAALLSLRTGVIRLDSQAKYAMVAKGLANIYLRRSASKNYDQLIWDHAAGCLLVEEAGGRTSDLEGNSLVWRCRNVLDSVGGIVASNVGDEAHAEILRVLRDLQHM